jgi:hypothetical protein
MKRMASNYFDPELLASMCAHVEIPSKERREDENDEEEGGTPRVLTRFDQFLATQSYVLSEIAKGKKEGANTFFILKCLDPGTRVLTADLRWVAIAELEIGDKLIGFDDNPIQERRRAYRISTVVDHWRTKQFAWRVSFDDGRRITCSAHHKFLCRYRGGVNYRWMPLMRCKLGDQIKSLVKPWGESQYEDGWAGGFIDGEGSLHCKKGQGTRVSVYQRPGETIDRYREYLRSRGIPYYETTDKRVGKSGNIGKQGATPIQLVAVARFDDCLKLIGLTRPTRFIASCWWEGKEMHAGKCATITAIEPLAEQELVDIETTAGTFIAEGLLTHNCRQSGVTTLGLGVALMWCFRFAGMIFGFIADTAQRLALNRKLCKQFVRSLKAVPEWRQEVTDDNRYELSFGNDSSIYWMNANSDDEGGLGRSIGLTSMWVTEIGLCKDVEGMLSLLSSISENNPIALNVLEGTAKGPNLFKELYDIAKEPTNQSQRAIFVPWWIHPWYEHQLDNPVHKERFKVYWGQLPRLTRDEARWVESIKLRYSFDIRPTQISWWRWHLRERKKDNLLLMYQEYPPLEEDAWTYGGNSFVDGRKLSVLQSRAMSSRKDPRKYFVFDPGDGVKFETSDLREVNPDHSYFDLVCYAEPVVGPRVRYCIGHDPSHGADPEGDHCCSEVLLCYLDKAVQVAEFLKREIPTYQQAWVILHLVGAYNSGESETHLNIEMQGGGDQIYDEIKRLQKELAYGYTPKLARYFQRMSHYLYTRSDSMSSKGSTVHWETSWRTRPRMLHNLKNLIERGSLELKSEEAIKEIASMSQLRTGEIETGDQNHRLMALAIAGMAYIQILEMDIAGQKEFLSDALKQVHGDNLNPAALTPDQVMNGAVDRWRQDVLAQEIEEHEDYSDSPGWLYQEDVAENDFEL